MDKLDFNELNEVIKEYLKFQGMDNVLDKFAQEERKKHFPSKSHQKSHQLNITPTVIPPLSID